MPEFYSNGRVAPAGHGAKWIADAWTLFKRSPGTWVGITLIVLVITGVLGYLRVPGVIASLLLAPVFSGGLMIGCKALDEGGALKVQHLFAGFRERFGSLVLVGVFYFAANFVITFISALVAGEEVRAALAAGADPAEVVMQHGSSV